MGFGVIPGRLGNRAASRASAAPSGGAAPGRQSSLTLGISRAGPPGAANPDGGPNRQNRNKSIIRQQGLDIVGLLWRLAPSLQSDEEYGRFQANRDPANSPTALRRLPERGEPPS